MQKKFDNEKFPRINYPRECNIVTCSDDCTRFAGLSFGRLLVRQSEVALFESISLYIYIYIYI